MAALGTALSERRFGRVQRPALQRRVSPPPPSLVQSLGAGDNAATVRCASRLISTPLACYTREITLDILHEDIPTAHYRVGAKVGAGDVWSHDHIRKAPKRMISFGLEVIRRSTGQASAR